MLGMASVVLRFDCYEFPPLPSLQFKTNMNIHVGPPFTKVIVVLTIIIKKVTCFFVYHSR